MIKIHGMDLAIYGAGGFALQMLDTVERLQADGWNVCFVSDGGTGDLCGVPVVSAGVVPENAAYCIAIANCETRAKVASRLKRFGTLRAASAIISRHAAIGEGAVIAHNVVIEARAKIGRHFHANVGSFVAHECVIGDFVTLCPKAVCNGNVHIGSGSFVGAGAVIKNGSPSKPLIIGAGAVIGCGAVVTRNVPAGATMVGNPARPLFQAVAA